MLLLDFHPFLFKYNLDISPIELLASHVKTPQNQPQLYSAIPSLLMFSPDVSATPWVQSCTRYVKSDMSGGHIEECGEKW